MFLTRGMKPHTHRQTFKRHRFRPGLEGLEARDVPAIFTASYEDTCRVLRIH